MRQTVWDAAERILPAGARLLDLGCGTGEDAIHFAQRGMNVTAIDIAPEMIEALVLKARAAEVSDRIDARVSDMGSLELHGKRFDAVFSNFGAMNCIGDLELLRALASNALRPGGHLVLVLMGRFYPLETLAFLMKGDVRRIFRRFGAARSATVEGQAFPVWYYSPRDLRRGFGREFALSRILGLRALLPAPGLEHLEGRVPFGLLGSLDAALARFPLTASFADHYLSIWRYL